MAIAPESVSLAVLLVLHLALLIWAIRKIIKSKISGFEKTSWFLLCLVLPLLGVGIYAAYEKKYLLKKELLHIVIAILLLGFLFSFRQWGVAVFDIGIGFNNWLRMSCLVLVALGIHISAQKRMARHYDAMSVFRLWTLGVILSIALIFVTNGWFVWAAVGCAAISTERFYRVGRRTEEEAIMPYELAKIMAAGSFASFGLAVLGNLLEPALGKVAHQFMLMNLWIAVFSVVPLFLFRMSLTLSTSWFGEKVFRRKKRWLEPITFPDKPYLRGRRPIVMPKTIRRIGESWLSEGEIMLFGSRPLWVFTFVFIVIATVLILFINAFLSLLAALVVAIVAYSIWHYKMEPQHWVR